MDTDFTFKETTVATTGLVLSFGFFLLIDRPALTNGVLELAGIILIASSVLVIFTLLNQLKLFYSLTLGFLSFATVTFGVLLAGIHGLNNSTPQVVFGLLRLLVAVFIIWKITAEMRNLKLEIDPFAHERSNLAKILYGLLYPPKELIRLIRILVYVTLGFYFVMSGLDMLSSAAVNLQFLTQTEKIGTNLIFIGIQTPMMMSSRASVSRTFSDYLKNVQWAEYSLQQSVNRPISKSYNQMLNSAEISYETINSNGKHMWLSIVAIIVLQAYQAQIIAVNFLNQIDFRVWINMLVSFIQQILG